MKGVIKSYFTLFWFEGDIYQRSSEFSKLCIFFCCFYLFERFLIKCRWCVGKVVGYRRRDERKWQKEACEVCA